MDSIRGVTLAIGLLVAYCLLGCHVALVDAQEGEEDVPRIIDFTSDAASNEIDEGQSINMDCEVANLGFGNGVGWRRINPPVDSNPGKTVSLAYSAEVEAEVPDRYKASLRGVPGDPKRGIAKLSISSARAEDSGTYLCEIKGTIKVSKSIEVNVLVLPENGSLVFKREEEELINNGEVSFGRNDKGSFSCSLTNVFPKPSIRILIGDKEIASDAVYVASSEDTGNVDFKRTIYSGTVTVLDYAIEPEFNGKLLSCEVKVGKKIPVVVGVMLSVAHPPKLSDCKANSATIGAKEVSLTCNFEGDPRPKVTWKVPSGQIIQADIPGAVTATEKQGDKGYITMLKITNVAQKDFGKYEITAQQEGEPDVKTTITLTEVKKGPARGSSTAVTWSLICMLLTTLLAVLGC